MGRQRRIVFPQQGQVMKEDQKIEKASALDKESIQSSYFCESQEQSAPIAPPSEAISEVSEVASVASEVKKTRVRKVPTRFAKFGGQ